MREPLLAMQRDVEYQPRDDQHHCDAAVAALGKLPKES